jgi:hypothetical protein
MDQAASFGHPLTPFVDKLVVPARPVVTEPTLLAVRLETAMHRFHGAACGVSFRRLAHRRRRRHPAPACPRRARPEEIACE